MINRDKIPKRKITIALDEDVVGFFQMLAHKDGDRPYQPLMNKVLREYVAEQVKLLTVPE